MPQHLPLSLVALAAISPYVLFRRFHVLVINPRSLGLLPIAYSLSLYSLPVGLFWLGSCLPLGFSYPASPSCLPCLLLLFPTKSLWPLPFSALAYCQFPPFLVRFPLKFQIALYFPSGLIQRDYVAAPKTSRHMNPLFVRSGTAESKTAVSQSGCHHSSHIGRSPTTSLSWRLSEQDDTRI